MNNTEPQAGLSVCRTSRVEWYDTDASGHYHHATVSRWVEAAEADLYRKAGLQHMFGRIPRVRYEVDYRSRAWFGDEVETVLRVERLGTASMTFSFEVTSGRDLVASGRFVTVNAEPDAAGSAPWPEEIRVAFGATRLPDTDSGGVRTW